jgi:uncharacterized protein
MRSGTLGGYSPRRPLSLKDRRRKPAALTIRVVCSSIWISGPMRARQLLHAGHLGWLTTAVPQGRVSGGPFACRPTCATAIRQICSGARLGDTLMHRLTAQLILCACFALLTSCASPASRFYTLSAAATAPAPSSDLSLVVGPVSVPASVDRPEIVVATGPNQVRIEEYDRWAAPLQDEISRAVAENLVALLGTPRVTQSSETLSGGAEYRAGIEVQKFESAPGESATLDAVWTVRRINDDKSRMGRTTVREALPQQGYDALAAAHSRAIARLSQDIADAVLALDHAVR